MKILFKVDQHAAIKVGIDAPSPTVWLDVTPAWLTQLERDVLAAATSAGNDATQTGIGWYEGEVLADPYGPVLQLLSPTVDGMRHAISDAMAKAKKRAEAGTVEGPDNYGYGYLA